MKENMKEEIIKIDQQLSKDDLQFQRMMLHFAEFAKYIKKDLNNVQPNNTFNKTFSKSDVIAWLANPHKYEKKLRDLSRFLLDSSSHYRRLIDYFSTMLTFDYVVDIYNQTDYEITKDLIATIEKKYIATLNLLETMNIKHEFLKLTYRAFIDDIAYGYIYSTKNSFFFDLLNPDYCAISSIEDGCYNYSFSFNYFDTYPKDLERYAPEFREKYEIYKKDRKNMKWQELDSSKTICIKASNTDYPIPPLAGIFEDIYSLYEYKDLQLSKTELENYLLLIAKIPYQSDAKDRENAWALSLDIAKEYYQLMGNNLPDQIGLALSPFDSVESIKLNKSEKELDGVSLAENSIYNSAGVPKLIFNSDKASGAALNKAIMSDESTVFQLLRQFERWINRRLKDENKKINFKVTFLDITRYNKNELATMYREASTVGLPVKRHYCASLGLSPSDVMNSMLLENDVMKITDKFVPLKSAYQDSNKGGAKSKGDNIEGSTEAGQVVDSNNPDNRA